MTLWQLINAFSKLTRTEFPEVVEVSVQTGVIASKYIQLSLVGNCIRKSPLKTLFLCFVMKISNNCSTTGFKIYNNMGQATRHWYLLTPVKKKKKNTITGHFLLSTNWFVSYRLNDSCVHLSTVVLLVCWAKCWSLSRTPWSCCSTAHCWSGKDQSGLRVLRTHTFSSQWWWRSGSPSTVLGCPMKKNQHTNFHPQKWNK